MKYDQVSRVFTTSRSYTTKEGEEKVFVQAYPFTTWSYVYDTPREDATLSALFFYCQQLLRGGRPEIGDRKSVSQLPLMLINKRGIEVTRIDDPIVQDAEEAGYEGGGHEQHRIMQRHLMRFNSSIIASEVPVWNGEVMGHIDYIQWDKERKVLRVLDFKPAAFKETKASSQVCRYIHLLADQLGIDPKTIEGGYFDKDEFYQVIF